MVRYITINKILIEMDYIVDMQGFQSLEYDFVCKELAFSIVGSDSQPNILFFKPPHHWLKLPLQYRNVNRWLEKHHHGN